MYIFFYPQFFDEVLHATFEDVSSLAGMEGKGAAEREIGIGVAEASHGQCLRRGAAEAIGAAEREGQCLRRG